MSLLIRLIELDFMAERTAMPVPDDTPLAASGYRMVSADLAIGPGLNVVIPATMKLATRCASRFDTFVGGPDCAN
jgi:hypothetical protein